MSHHHHHHSDHSSHESSGPLALLASRPSRVVLSFLLLAVAVVIERSVPLERWQLLLVYLVPYLVGGYDILLEAAESIAHREPFDENLLMAIASLGALAIGFLPGVASHEFAEAVMVVALYQLGEVFEHYAEGQSRRSIAHLVALRPEQVSVEREGGVQKVAPGEVKAGETCVVTVGERIALDGVVVEGTSSLDTSALTGESVPRRVREGDEVLSGSVNQSAVLRLRVTKPSADSTLSRIIDLVEHAAEKKSRSEAFITRFARVYTPAVVLAALAIAVLPPLFSATPFSVWLYRALTFLVVSCPCALVISVPLTYFGGIGASSRHGILVKGSAFIDSLARAATVVFDKTGTLTRGTFSVTVVHPHDISSEQLLHLAAHVERYSTHPIALALRQAYAHEHDDCSVESVREVAGEGVEAVVNGQTVRVGNTLMMEHAGIQPAPCPHEGTVLHVSIDGRYAGHVVVSDTVKDDAALALSQLRTLGVRRTVMLTGDNPQVAESVARSLDSAMEWHAALLPAEKVERVAALVSSQREGEQLLFVGDGINDAPALARADVGVAMGALGSDAAIEAADVVLMNDRPTAIATAIGIARRTRSIARQNVAFAVGVKMFVLLLAAFGLCTMWMAVVADVGVMALCVLNAMRTLVSPFKAP